LVEGPTEERFVKDVLAPYFWPKGIHLEPIVLVTKRVVSGPNFKGGLSTFGQYERDMRRLLQKPGGALVTTLIDYYGLPADFPGLSTRPADGTPRQRVEHVEKAIHAHFKSRSDFAPFLALHEFEAFLFSDTGEIAAALSDNSKLPQLEAIRSQFPTPEDINDDPQSAPSKRLEAIFPSYSKVLHGPTVAKRIGVDAVRSECPHFDLWLHKLESYW
jgi:hypothetical protein